jgi:hypothetical protein
LSVFPAVRSVAAGAIQVPEEADLRPVVNQFESDVLDVHRHWEAGVKVAPRTFRWDVEVVIREGGDALSIGAVALIDPRNSVVG